MGHQLDVIKPNTVRRFEKENDQYYPCCSFSFDTVSQISLLQGRLLEGKDFEEIPGEANDGYDWRLVPPSAYYLESTIACEYAFFL